MIWNGSMRVIDGDDLGYSSAVSFCKNRAELPTAFASLSKKDVKLCLRWEGDQKDPVSVN